MNQATLDADINCIMMHLLLENEAKSNCVVGADGLMQHHAKGLTSIAYCLNVHQTVIIRYNAARISSLLWYISSHSSVIDAMVDERIRLRFPLIT